MKSIIQANKNICFICGKRATEEHHCIYGTANRKLSEKDGLKVYLCHWCHNEPPFGVHHNKNTDLKLKIIAEKKWIEYYHKTKEDFIRRYGKNYI